MEPGVYRVQMVNAKIESRDGRASLRMVSVVMEGPSTESIGAVMEQVFRQPARIIDLEKRPTRTRKKASRAVEVTRV